MKTVADAWLKHQATVEHADAVHKLQRNGHLHAADELRAAFEAGWNAKPREPAPAPPAKAPAKAGGKK